ncbi:hypothetical protein [Luteimonas aquatica]|uniref:hypothetical protein n=1 Tax=Luteimonas aquatica TaxID=450364 RepID=UPI001F5A57A3|nr:hypothetical protein [Luteimonas aquatica]
MSNTVDIIGNLAKLTLSGDIDGAGANKSWLHAVAKAMGQKMGELASSMVTNANLVASPNEKISSSASAKLTADSQLFSMVSNATSTALKSAGEGNVALVRK